MLNSSNQKHMSHMSTDSSLARSDLKVWRKVETAVTYNV